MQEQLVKKFAEHLPPLKKPKGPVVAALAAVAFGGSGLAVYLRSWIDAAVTVIGMVLLLVAIDAGFQVGTLAILASLGQYAYTRVEASNRQLRGHADADPATGAAQPAT
jgi:hypothetical protein